MPHDPAPPLIEKLYASGGKIVVAQSVDKIELSSGPKEYPRPREYVHFRALNFVGRSNELERMIDLLLTEGSIGIYAIKGMGGIGKTVLAAEVAAALDDEELYPGGVLWTNLTAESPSEAARRWLGNYGFDVSHEDEQTRLMRLGTVLSQIPALLILDNAQDANTVRKLIIRSAGLAVLVTTRKQTAVPMGVRSIALDELMPHEALALLEVLAGERIQDETDVATDICALCGHLPLAVTIAGSQLGNNGRWATLSDYKAQLEKRRLELLSMGGFPEDNIRLTLDVSYQELDDPLKNVFDSLGLFAGSSFPTEAIAEMGGWGEQADDLIEQLVGLSLVMRVGYRRYRLHDLIKDYAYQRLLERHSTELRLWQKRLTMFYQEYSRIYASQFSALDAERQNVLGTIEFTIEENDPEWSMAIIGIARNSTNYFKFRGLWKEAAHFGEKGYQLASKHGLLDDQAHIATWLLSWVYFHQGNSSSAENWARKGLELYDQTGDEKDRATAVRRVGMTLMSSGQLDHARIYLQEALQRFREIPLPSRIGDTLTALGYLERKQGEFDLALSYLNEALTIVREIGDQKETSMTLYQMGRLESAKGRFIEAEQLHDESLEIDTSLRRKPGIAWNLLRLGQLKKSLGNESEAVEDLQKAMRLFDEMGVSERVSQIHEMLIKSK